MSLYEFRGHRNLCGKNIRKFRLEQHMSQVDLAAKLQLEELMIESNNISKIELGKRFLIDYELRIFAKVLGVSMTDLMTIPDEPDAE